MRCQPTVHCQSAAAAAVLACRKHHERLLRLRNLRETCLYPVAGQQGAEGAGGRSTADADPAAPRGHQQHDNSGRAHPLDDPARTKALKDSLLASKCWMTPEGGLEALPADVDVEADGIAPAQVGLHPRPRDVIHTCGICGSNANSPPAHGCVRCPPAALRGRLARPHLHQRVNLCRMDSILKRPPVKRRQPCLKAWRTSKSWSPG